MINLILGLINTEGGYYSLKHDVGDQRNREEDGGHPTSNISYKGKDGGLQTVSYALPANVLWRQNQLQND